ncbi:ADP-ribosylation factor GTPase-activating protein 1 [Fistulifera solaris]|uniref:ADP-ribosylation factor GTPase-activating protein 1 n=1 Tax=Fistulifera solaris TaxID=1519565 RepID=A0A1Z5JFC9_FISSO|nr:ADP-ribosylation factor GTPase-activating protein 1 [Fistulifera solaris]|eukprot:GAX12714.1 ADP-ribosylation factor GTPase-activating protein 1 [Fistulifera solaris]
MDDEAQMRPEDFAYLQTLPGNDVCVDCGNHKPDWGSPKLGILFCFDCSGRHRGLGTHLSFVRSVAMDRWSEKQIKLMKAGGNKQLNDFLEEYQIKTKKTTAKEKYDNPVAELYRQKLDARVEGRIEPTELPKVPVKVNVPLRKMEGFGSSPPPPRPASHTGRNVALGGIAVAIVGVGAWLVLQQ